MNIIWRSTMKRPTIKEITRKAEEMPLEDACSWLLELSEEFGDMVQKIADKYFRKLEAQKKELERLHSMMAFENEARSRGYRLIGGIDEAGRGPLAGPVVAACVILPEDAVILGLNDSKKLTPAKRERLYDEIKEKAIAYGIGMADHTYIDRVNILNATKKAMEDAIRSMKVRPDFLIIDAVHLDIDIQQESFPKADYLSASVAAASILAKVTRDRLMDEMDIKYPGYGFAKHKGYGTREHIEAIKRLGLCPIHRRSFTSDILESKTAV